MNELSRRSAGDEDGFTLIELAVVILIIGILLAIAIPTFLGVRSRAQNKSSQSSLRNSLVAAKTAYSDSGNFTSVTLTTLQSIEPGIIWASGGTSLGPNDLRYSISGSTYTAWSKSDGGNCYGIQENLGASGTVFASRTGTAACDGTGFTFVAKWT